ncbi:MAG: dockerin type I repeat-containing protein [Ruminococcus sp.]|nr:dockerin type I repeat-containing protein [Ruminococcus sp.]
MKIIKLIITSVMLILISAISITSISAVLAGYIIAGDTDMNGEVTIKDATTIQKSIAGIEDFNKRQCAVADVDGDDNITIKDATIIQKKCASLIESFDVPEHITDYIRFYSFNANYDSGKAMTGVPVNFFVSEIYSEPSPVTYKFYINSVAVTDIISENNYTHTFDESGEYKIEVVAYNDLDNHWSATIQNYVVVEPYENEDVSIKAFYHNYTEKALNTIDTEMVFTAEGMFGSGEYEYAFYVDNELKQNFSTTNTYPVGRFEEEREYTFTVIIKDKCTGKTATENMTVSVREPLPGP